MMHFHKTNDLAKPEGACYIRSRISSGLTVPPDRHENAGSHEQLGCFAPTMPSLASISSLSLPCVDLTLERALSLIDEPARHNYEAMYRWFIEGAGAPASTRLYGQRLPGVDSNFAHCAQRGIHVPSHQKYAASITISSRSKYSDAELDGKRIALSDGSWLLYYCAHSNRLDDKSNTQWMNDGLMRCYRDGVPVGVFKQEPGNRYTRDLAFVESYDEERKLFTLHGPVTYDNDALFSAPFESASRFEYEYVSLPSVETLQEDTRTQKESRMVVRKGQNRFRKALFEAYGGSCALCGGVARETLQGAHIIEYRGESPNCTQNGLLLRADIHVLFDRLLLSVKPDSHEIVLSESLAHTEYEMLFGNGKSRRLRMPKDKRLAPNDDYLDVHHRLFLAKQNTPLFASSPPDRHRDRTAAAVPLPQS